ncbi:hypothetical protein FNV43_RR06200 [Rhamnella rubrinervis]|uniref:Uncharacterized protein n=1 Tax=Rhamnella rubrinervis TaxID=2594499 RepID=A0A8K0HE33_9ROSA|nr:hypothetical protein FNV43_RR06200 [Rhamnella rubrinervis]
MFVSKSENWFLFCNGFWVDETQPLSEFPRKHIVLADSLLILQIPKRSFSQLTTERESVLQKSHHWDPKSATISVIDPHPSDKLHIFLYSSTNPHPEYQRVSPDCLPLSNGKKPNIENGKIIQTNGNSNTSLETKAAFRFRSPARNQDHHNSLSQFSGVSENNLPHHSHHENISNTQQTQRQENSPSPTPSPSHGGSGDVLLQWGHKKRARVSRAEIRALTDESSSSAHARQAVKLQRRLVHSSSSSSEKLTTNTTMPPPPPPPPITSSSSNGRARKETSGLLPSRNLEDRSGTGNGSPSRNGGGSRVVSRSAGKRSPPPDKNEKKVLACSGKLAKEEKQNGSAVQACDRMNNNHVDSASLQSEQQQQHHQEAVATNINNIHAHAHAHAHAYGGEKLSFEAVEWPRIYLSLSRKEKEDDFLAMKGTKLPQRPKKRAKNVDRTLQYCFPGMWLSDLTRNRYEVREKKCVKKQKRRGLKGMESVDSDSE